MSNFLVSHGVVVLLIVSLGNFGFAIPQRGLLRPFQQVAQRRAPPVICTHDSLMVYMDCRLCVCPRPNRVAKCFRKSCDLRTKDGGQCPPAVLRMDDSKLCSANQQQSGCKVDADCPGPQLCCFDFCLGTRCVNPVPLDISSGMPVHSGRGFQ